MKAPCQLRSVLLTALALSLTACSGPPETEDPVTAPAPQESTEAVSSGPEAAVSEPAPDPPWQPPEVFPPYLEGRLTEINKDVLVPLFQPDEVLGGLPINARMRLGPDGELIYEHRGDLNRMVPDPVYRDSEGEWVYPDEPMENDEWLSTPACRGLMEGFDNPDSIRFFWIDPHGSIAYTCPHQRERPQLHYVDGHSVEMGTGVIYALGTYSRTLGRGGRWDEWGIDDQGTFIPVERTGTPWARNDPNLIHADQEGFLVVFLNEEESWQSDGVGTLHRLDYNGTVELIGEYGPPVEPVDGGHRYFTLVPGGDLYMVHRRSEEDLVFRFLPELGEPGQIVYRLPNRPVSVERLLDWAG